MKLNLQYIPERAILWAEATGEVTLSSVQQAAIDGLRLAKEHQCSNYLIDLSKAVITLSIADAIVFIEGLTEMKFSRHDRVAFVISTRETDHKFWKLAALNRGWSQVAYFTDPSEAEKWLAP